MKSLIFILLFLVVFCDEPKRAIIGLNVSSLPYKTTPDKKLKIAFGSCLDQDSPMPIWNAIKQKNPNLMLLIGDNVYGDSNSPGLPELKQAYLKQQKNINALKLSFPIWAIWDDHDYGVNDGGAEFRYKDDAKTLFLDFFQAPKNDSRRQRDGLYFAKKISINDRNIKLLFLDTRSFRGRLKPTDSRGAPGKERYVPAPNSQSSMLGVSQWAWLSKNLGEQVDLVILISSIQVIAEGHGFERWGLLPHEQQRLFELLSTSNAKKIIILSGDRHRAGIYKKEISDNKQLWELTSSSLNKPSSHAEEPGPYRLGATYQKENFGLIKVNGQTKKISLQIHNKTGQKVLVEEINW
jgi:alkaline phosphatase D